MLIYWVWTIACSHVRGDSAPHAICGLGHGASQYKNHSLVCYYLSPHKFSLLFLFLQPNDSFILICCLASNLKPMLTIGILKACRHGFLNRLRLFRLTHRENHTTRPHLARNCAICDNAQSASRAYKTLRSAPYVIIDTEGHKRKSFNHLNDSLSLIQVGTPGASQVFLFDMRSLRTDARRGILALLADPRVLKIGWGLPADFEILYNGYGTRLASMLDLQIVDIHSRVRRGENDEARIARLAWRSVPYGALLARGLELKGIHALNGMDAALTEHDIKGVPLKECRCWTHHTLRTLYLINGVILAFPASSWDIRPLKLSLSRYAANDIVRISALYDHFRQRGFLKARHVPQLMLQSALYVGSSILSGFPLQNGSNIWRSNILPLGILDIIGPNESTFFFKNHILRRCTSCRRALTINCFPTAIPHPDMCRVCILLQFREAYVRRRPDSRRT